MIFKQKTRPRNLGNPKAIAFLGVKDCPALPSDEDFKKVETMIGELLKPFSADLPHTVEIAGQILSNPVKGASPSAPKDFSHPSGTQLPPPDPTKARTNRVLSQNRGNYLNLLSPWSTKGSRKVLNLLNQRKILKLLRLRRGKGRTKQGPLKRKSKL